MIPSRYANNMDNYRKSLAPLRWLGGVREPTAQEIAEFGETLNQGDPLADELLAWMEGFGILAGRALIDEILIHGLENIQKKQNVPEILKNFINNIENPPDWVDWARIEAGQLASHRPGKKGVYVLRDLALMGGYQASSINKTLIQTGALTKGAFRREAETTSFWIDVTEIGGLSRFGKGFRTAIQVRILHAMVRRQVQKRPSWRAEEWGLPINQGDMLATNLAFSSLYIFGLRALGHLFSRQEHEDIMHLWRYIGWLLGINETLLPENTRAGIQALYLGTLTQSAPDESSRALGVALSQTPLLRQYPKWQLGRATWEYHKHLGFTRFFLGKTGMRNLGLSKNILPWYAVGTLPFKFLFEILEWIVPFGKTIGRKVGRWREIQYAQHLLQNVPADFLPKAEHHGALAKSN